MDVLPLRLAPGADLRTTAELMLAFLALWHFRREADPATGYAELLATPAVGKGAAPS